MDNKKMGILVLAVAALWWFVGRTPPGGLPGPPTWGLPQSIINGGLPPPTGGLPYRTVAEIEAATGAKVVDIYDWNRLNPTNPITVTPRTTYAGVSPAVDYSSAVKAATEQAQSTGSPTYVEVGGYFVDAGGSYIKGAGW